MCFSFFAFEDKLYLFGGESDDRYYNDFHCFNVGSKTWKA